LKHFSLLSHQGETKVAPALRGGRGLKQDDIPYDLETLNSSARSSGRARIETYQR